MIDPRSTRAYKLEKENRELKKEIELLRNGNDITKIINDNVVFLRYQREQQEEIERLNNIINEFDKWLLGEQMMFYRGSDNERLIRFGETKNKWLELKGSSNNE